MGHRESGCGRAGGLWATILALGLLGCEVGQPASPVAAPPVEAAASWSGGRVAAADLEAEHADELRDLEVRYLLDRYEVLHRALDAKVEGALLEAERARLGLVSIDALMAAEVAAKAVAPTEEEVKRDFARFQLMAPDTPYEAVRAHLHAQLLRQREEERRLAFLDELKTRAGLTVRLAYPDIPRIEVPIRDHDPLLGDTNAPVTVIQFAEYQCYYCRRVAPLLERLVDEHPGDVRVVMKDFPLTGHERARMAAVAAHCAGGQGRYWEMGEVLLDHPDQLGEEHLRGYALELGLDAAVWDDCMRDPIWLDRVDQDVHDGRAAGVGSTPTLFVNGLMLNGAQPYARLDALVEQELVRLRGVGKHRSGR